MITTRFHIRLDWDYPCNSAGWDDVVENNLFELKREIDHIDELSIFGGNGACGPYLEAESLNQHDAARFEMCARQLLEAYGCYLQYSGEEQ